MEDVDTERGAYPTNHPSAPTNSFTYRIGFICAKIVTEKIPVRIQCTIYLQVWFSRFSQAL